MTEGVKRVAEEAKRTGQQSQRQAERLGQEYQHQAERAGQQWQHAAQNGFEAAVRSWEEFNKGRTSIAAELRDYSKNAFEDATNAWGRVLSARTLPDVVEAQSEYTRKSYEKHIAQATKLGKMYVGLFENAYRRVEQTFRS